MQSNTRQVRANTGNRIALGVLIILVSLLSFLSDVRALGGVGRMVASFTVGFFGLADYAYSVVGIIIGVAVIFNLRVRLPIRKILLYVGLFAIGVYALQIYTSSAHIVGAGYGKYLVACYQNTNTAGGMLFGIPAYPLMKALTPVGALIVACAAFFVLAFFAFFPTIKKNVVYTAAGKSERDKKVKRNAQSSKMDMSGAPALTDLSSDGQGGQKLYVVDVEGDTMKKGGKKAKGADGYNPLYPNAAGGIEDEAVRPTAGNAADNRDKYSARDIARDILIGGGASDENLRRFNTANNPESALNNPSAPYSALRRRELRDRLGIDGQNSQNGYSVPREQTEQPKAESEKPIKETVSPSKDKSNTVKEEEGGTLGYASFEELKAEQTKRFGERMGDVKPEFSATAYPEAETEDPMHAEVEKNQVVKPLKTVRKPEIPVVRPTDAANVAGFSGIVGRTIAGVEPSAPQPVVKHEIISEAYETPSTPSYTERKPSFDANSANYENPRQNAGNTQNLGNVPTAVNNGVQAAQAPQRPQSSVGQNPENKGNAQNAGNTGSSASTARPSTTRPEFTVDRPQPREDKAVDVRSGIDWQRALHGAAAAPETESRTQQSENYGAQSGRTQSAPSAAPVDNAPKTPTSQHIISSVSDASTEKPIDSGGKVYQQSFLAKQQAEAVEKARQDAPPMTALEKARADQERAAKAARKIVLPGRDQQSRAVEKKAKEMENIDVTKQRVAQVTMDESISQVTPRRPYKAPPMSLLYPPDPEVEQDDDLEQKKEALCKTLAFFDVEANVTDIKVGPTFSLYTLSVNMPKGKSIGSINAYEKDICAEMEESSVRILAPIPGKNAVGIEVPNKKRRIVRLSELLNAQKFNQSPSPATFGLGKDLYGTDYVCDIKELPHMLIAGQTGAGKSCCINSLIVSLLYKASPEEVRLILIDPKRVELSVYAGIPHLMLDEIVCDVDKAIRALNWAIGEMNRRIQFLSEQKFRDIDEYNKNCTAAGFEKMPRIVIVVDELADLMSLGKKAVEDSINRIARLARAVGIHLILATQRPSVDVISGTIKNNLPTRVAFRVPSGADSRTVIDAYGADKLLGNGDLLYMTPKAALPTRMQGAYISNEEVKAVVDYIKENNESYYDQSVKEAIFKAQEEKSDSDSKVDKRKPKGLPPELFAALRIGMEESISVSYLQRKLGLGWQKAAKIGDLMEEMGVLVPDEKDPKRKRVNLTDEELQQLIRDNEEDSDE